MVGAACCGLLVGSTDVGGVPEVLPPHMVRLAAPRADEIVEALSRALDELIEVVEDPKGQEKRAFEFHEEVKQMYDWHDVARRTELVYNSLMDPERTPNVSLRDRLLRFLRVGPVAGKIFMLVAALDTLLWWFLEWLQPAERIEIARELPLFPAQSDEQHCQGRTALTL